METLRRLADRSDTRAFVIAVGVATLVLVLVVAAAFDGGALPVLLILAGGAVLAVRRFRRGPAANGRSGSVAVSQPPAAAPEPATATIGGGGDGPPDQSTSVLAPPPPPQPALVPQPLDRTGHRIAAATLAIVSVAVGGVLLALAEADVIDVSASWLVAGAALGVVLCAAAFTLLRAGRPLACLGASIGLVLVALAAADVPFRGGAGARTFVPTSVSDLQRPYELGAGRLVLDLRQLELPLGQPVPVRAHVGLGELTVIVRDEDRVRLTGAATLGEVRLGSWADEGLGVRTTTEVPAAAGEEHELEGSSTLLLLDLRVGIGDAEVVRAYDV